MADKKIIENKKDVFIEKLPIMIPFYLYHETKYQMIKEIAKSSHNGDQLFSILHMAHNVNLRDPKFFMGKAIYFENPSININGILDMLESKEFINMASESKKEDPAIKIERFACQTTGLIFVKMLVMGCRYAAPVIQNMAERCNNERWSFELSQLAKFFRSRDNHEDKREHEVFYIDPRRTPIEAFVRL